MKLWSSFFSDKRERIKWEAGLCWFRLRYLDAASAVKCINLLSRPDVCGRVVLSYMPDTAVSRLYLGLPEPYSRLFQRMVADFGFTAKSAPHGLDIPVAGRMTAVSRLPWGNAFVAHIVNGVAFVEAVEAINTKGDYFPQVLVSEKREQMNRWRLPDLPPIGMTMQPAWRNEPVQTSLVATAPDPQKWLLGRSKTGTPLHVAGRVNIYGRQGAVAAWLVSQVTQMIRINHENLVVIDGVGDLVSTLKRKAAVTQLLGEQLSYIDFDGLSLASGFNPLAPAPGETDVKVRQRWQRWFQGMNVHPEGVVLLAQAQKDGVTDILGLQKWLKQMERQGQHTAVSNLKMVLERLTSSRTVQERLEWPTNCFDVLPSGAIFFSCKANSWAREQLLRAFLLGTMAVANARIVVHGFPWELAQVPGLEAHEQLVISNGPMAVNSAVVLTESNTKGIVTLADRFLDNDDLLTENLALLGMGESIVMYESDLFYSTWT